MRINMELYMSPVGIALYGLTVDDVCAQIQSDMESGFIGDFDLMNLDGDTLEALELVEDIGEFVTMDKDSIQYVYEDSNSLVYTIDIDIDFDRIRAEYL